MTMTKIMLVGDWTTAAKIRIGCEELDECEKFCYLGSIINNDGGCDREIMIRLGKTNSEFGRLRRIWANRNISTQIKVHLYESLVLTVLLYGTETWPMKQKQTTARKLEAAHHQWLRKILRISWKDNVTNDKDRQLTQQTKLEDTIREWRLRWMGHVLRMESDRTARAEIDWTPPNGKTMKGRPRMDWLQMVKQDIRSKISWDQAPGLAVDQITCRELTALCVSHTGRSKV